MAIRKCICCNITIPEGRIKILPHTRTCVNCSTTSAYRAINTTNGTGDHTWNDIQIVTQEQYDQYQGQHDSKFDRIEESKEDNNLQGPLTIIKTD